MWGAGWVGEPRLDMSEPVFRKIIRTLGVFRKARGMTDVCDHCVHFRDAVVPRFTAFVAELRGKLQPWAPEYFRGFDAALKSKGLTTLDHPLRVLDGLVMYLKGHADRFPAQRPADAAALVEAEEAQLELLRLHRRIIESYVWHINIATEVRSATKDAAHQPPQGFSILHG
jgi:hypothetical protein